MPKFFPAGSVWFNGEFKFDENLNIEIILTSMLFVELSTDRDEDKWLGLARHLKW